MKITITPGCRKLVVKPTIGHFRPKNQRYYNWAEDENGPYGEDFEREVPRDQYHLCMLVKNDWIHLVDDKPKKVEKPKVDKKDKE